MQFNFIPFIEEEMDEDVLIVVGDDMDEVEMESTEEEEQSEKDTKQEAEEETEDETEGVSL